MRSGIIIAVSMLVLTVQAGAASKKAPPPRGRALFLKKLKLKCEDGVAVACNDYGLSLLNSKDPKDQKTGKFYIRRACTLAYAPACEQHSSSTTSKVVKPEVENKCAEPSVMKSAKLKSDSPVIESVEEGSLFAKAGLQKGDVITMVDGKPFTNRDQLVEALKKGGLPVINVFRQGQPSSVVIECK